MERSENDEEYRKWRKSYNILNNSSENNRCNVPLHIQGVFILRKRRKQVTT